MTAGEDQIKMPEMPTSKFAVSFWILIDLDDSVTFVTQDVGGSQLFVP